ncbi:ABC transporter ATP-binding protein [Ammoniphilus sp. CFH 90114]|uniref:ABC transporter ATP-binding protein n=1 Tax=Ammoniphilus sp. CFH 90114 TaxID=2493665 RepID=UPI00100E0CB3|nr:ABC transporter ATP-binding protein [Ammoniphilus sp. CFH 90114]RXT05689.1 ABC transporter ATP-binding protein [Ammoniphilus sp. CFH 90114]
MKTVQVELRNISLTFSKESPPVLDQINLELNQGEFVSMIGRSGCGKTSLLQLMAGLLSPTSGEVLVGGEKVIEPKEKTTYVFQRPILLEWKNVLENVLLPIELKRRVTEEDGKKAKEILKLVGLAGNELKFPHELSGGMMSRVSLARALMTEPKVLLMDEPFAALDALTKWQMQQELAKLSHQFHPTVVFITHDIQEAVYLSDRIFFMGGTPAGVLKEYVVPFPKPRRKELKFEKEFLDLTKILHDDIENIGSARTP